MDERPPLAVKQEGGCLKIVPALVPMELSWKRRFVLWTRRFFRCRLDVAKMRMGAEDAQKGKVS